MLRVARLLSAVALVFLGILWVATISALGRDLGLIMVLALIWLAFLGLAVARTARRLRADGYLQEGERVSLLELIRRARDAGARPRGGRGDAGS